MKRARTSSSKLAGLVAGIAIAAPQVVAARSLRMTLAGASPSARDRREFARMHTEKVEAILEAWLAVAAGMLHIQQQALLSMATAFWPGAVPPKTTSGSSEAMELMLAGITPMHRRVMANAKRLRKAR